MYNIEKPPYVIPIENPPYIFPYYNEIKGITESITTATTTTTRTEEVVTESNNVVTLISTPIDAFLPTTSDVVAIISPQNPEDGHWAGSAVMYLFASALALHLVV